MVFLDEEVYYTVTDKISALVDTYTSNVHFEIGNIETYQAQLKVAAVQNAKKKAVLLAEAAGAKLGKVLQIKDSHMSSGRGMRLMEANHEGAVPLEKGEEELRSKVFVRYELL